MADPRDDERDSGLRGRALRRERILASAQDRLADRVLEKLGDLATLRLTKPAENQSGGKSHRLVRNQTIVELQEKGVSWSSIAHRCNCSRATVYAVLKAAGKVDPTHIGKVAAGCRERSERIAQLLDEGKTTAEISDIIGITPVAVNRIIRTRINLQ